MGSLWATSPSGLPRRDDDYPARQKHLPDTSPSGLPRRDGDYLAMTDAGHSMRLSQLVIAPPGQARRGRRIEMDESSLIVIAPPGQARRGREVVISSERSMVGLAID
jgi:hypothetical protein